MNWQNINDFLKSFENDTIYIEIMSKIGVVKNRIKSCNITSTKERLILSSEDVMCCIYKEKCVDYKIGKRECDICLDDESIVKITREIF